MSDHSKTVHDIFDQVERVHSKSTIDDYFKLKIDKQDGQDPFDLIVADGIANKILEKSYIKQSKIENHGCPATVYEAHVGVILDIDEFTKVVNEAINDAYIRGVERGLHGD